MKENHEGLSKILEILKQNPRGMSVTQITEAVGMNRITVGHYLDILRTSGEVDMETFGQSKVYFLSHRVPISALMNHSSDYMIVLDNMLKIAHVNSNVISLMGRRKDEIVGKNIRSILRCIDTGTNIQQIIDRALAGEEVIEDIRILKDGEEHFFLMKVIPTVFVNGTPGITIILEDTTDYHKSVQALKESEEKCKELLKNISALLDRLEHIAELNDQIRDPLQVIVGITECENEDLMEQIRKQVDEIDRIIRQLDIGTVEAENVRTFVHKYAGAPEDAANGSARKGTKVRSVHDE